MGGEKLTKYFLNLPKIRAKNKTISQLVTDIGEVLTRPQDILAEQKAFYQKLYSREPLQRILLHWKISD